MNAEELRSVQAPLKEHYRQAPEAALATLLRPTERYCVVYQTLAHPPSLAVTRKRAVV